MYENILKELILFLEKRAERLFFLSIGRRREAAIFLSIDFIKFNVIVLHEK